MLEVQAKHPLVTQGCRRRGCGESAGFSSRGMCIEVHRELGRPNVLLKDKVGKSNREVRATMVHWESDRFIVGGQYDTEGNDSYVEACGRTHIPDKVELEQI